MKVLERILDKRIRAIANIAEGQCGFRPGLGTTDAIFAVRQLIEKHGERQRSIHLAFLDLEKAFDRVPHAAIWYSLRDHLVPEQYISWVKLLYKDAKSVVRCPVGTSKPFNISVEIGRASCRERV